MKTHLLHIALFFCGLLLVNSPITAQVLLPQYSVWEGFAFGDKRAVESREAEERFARFLLGLEQQNPTQQAEQIGELLAKAEQHNATVRFLTLAEKYLYDPNSPCRNDERYLLFLQYPSAWFGVYALEIDRQDLYDIKALPTLYLLDVQKKVIVKDGMIEHVIQYFNK